MPVLRFLTSLFALVALVALVADATPALNGTEAFKLTTVAGYWQELAPASLSAARTTVVEGSSPWVWDELVMGVLGIPTPILFGALAIACGFLGRRRQEMKYYIN